MKKHLLLGAAFAAMSLTAGAQTVQNIPTPEGEYLKLEPGYATFYQDPANVIINEDTGEVVEKSFITHVEEDAKGNPAYWMVENTKNNDYLELKLNNTTESCFIMKVDLASKTPGATVQYNIIDANGDVEWSGETVMPGTSQAWSAFETNTVFITDPITAGEKTLRIVFKDEVTNKNVVNMRNISFTAQEEIITHSLYLNVDPGEDAGTFTASPSADTYLENTHITLTASAAMGWEFVKIVDETYGDEYNASTYEFDITETSEFTAYFKELIMYSEMPGLVALNTRLLSNGKLETKTKVSLDGESVNDGGEVQNIGDVRHGKTQEFELRFAQGGEYTFKIAASTKMSYDKFPDANPQIDVALYDAAALDFDPATAPEFTYTLNMKGYEPNNWSKYTTYTADPAMITEGTKILRLTFTEDGGEKKYTCNVLRMGFGDASGDWFNEAGIENVAVDAAKGEVRAYNLQGIRVKADTKGLIIVNGEKVYNK